jgi:hypothetical protein
VRFPQHAPLFLRFVALYGIALAQPIYDLVGRSPEFLVAHRAGRAEILLLCVALTLGLPALCTLVVALASRVNHVAADLTTAVAIAIPSAACALLGMRLTLATPAIGAVPVAAAAGLAVGALHARLAGFRLFLSAFGALALAFPVVFLLRPSTRSLLAANSVALKPTRTASPVPVVFVVFDQLPLASIVDGSGNIERLAYPALAELAATSTWYRNATTVNPVTGWALPAILTGKRPRTEQLPVAADHPNSLFTLLASTHRMRVIEPITDLCPDDVCGREDDSMASRALQMASDLAIAYLHVILPRDLTRELPSVTNNWKGFAGDNVWQQRWGRKRDKARHGTWESFLLGIRPGEGPVLYYAHMLLPHDPFMYLPNGLRYTRHETMDALAPSHVWNSDDWDVARGYQRHLLQVAYVDLLVGQLLDRLRAARIFDEALIVITSDHGAGFRPGGPLRNVDPQQFAAIMCVPLIVKAPFQEKGQTDDRNVETIDILPTVAALLATEAPWKTDGSAALGTRPSRQYKELSYERARVTKQFPPSMLDQVLEIARRKERLFGPADGPFRMPRLSRYTSSLGSAVRALGPVVDGPVEITVDSPKDFTRVDPNSGFVPAQITGTVRCPQEEGNVELAIAVNGVVRGTTRSSVRRADGSGRWVVIVPPSSFEPGANRVEAFVVRAAADGSVRLEV